MRLGRLGWVAFAAMVLPAVAATAQADGLQLTPGGGLGTLALTPGAVPADPPTGLPSGEVAAPAVAPPEEPDDQVALTAPTLVLDTAPPVPEAPPLPETPVPPMPEAPPAPGAPAPPPAVDDLLDELADSPAAPAAAPAPGEAAPMPGVAPALPWEPTTTQSPGASGGPAGGSGSGAAPATGVGDAVAADLAPRMGLGPALRQGAEGPLAEFAQALGIPEAVRAPLAALLGLLVTGLAAVAASMAGFRHVGRENLLEHDFRQRLLALLREHPGMHLREIARRLDLTPTNASYHLRVLERHNVVRSEHLRGRRVYYPAAGRDERERFLAQSVLYQAPRAAVLRAIAANPGANQSRLAHLTAQHQGAVSWHVHQLMAAGMVEERRTARMCLYDLTPLGRTFADGGAAPAPAEAMSAPVPAQALQASEGVPAVAGYAA